MHKIKACPGPPTHNKKSNTLFSLLGEGVNFGYEFYQHEPKKIIHISNGSFSHLFFFVIKGNCINFFNNEKEEEDEESENKTFAFVVKFTHKMLGKFYTENYWNVGDIRRFSFISDIFARFGRYKHPKQDTLYRKF